MDFLFSNFTTLIRTGPKIAEFLQHLTGGNKVIDLLYHTPASIAYKNYLPKLYDVKDGEIIIAKVKVESHHAPFNKRQPFKIRCFSPSGYLTLIFFKTYPGYIEKNFKIGSFVIISGKIERFNGELQMSHPEYVVPENLIDQIPKNEVIYPLSYGVSQKFLRSKISEILSKINNFPEWLDNNLLKKNSWPSWLQSMNLIHNPQTSEDIGGENLARRRLAYDELLAGQLASRIAKRQVSNVKGRKTIGTGILQKKIIVGLPFELTDGQKKVLKQIQSDMESDKKMLRLLQGDVGSGKTIVAFLAMLAAVEAGHQAAIIVPIALLANQHFNNFSKLIKNLDIKIALLTSKTTKKQKAQIYRPS